IIICCIIESLAALRHFLAIDEGIIGIDGKLRCRLGRQLQLNSIHFLADEIEVLEIDVIEINSIVNVAMEINDPAADLPAGLLNAQLVISGSLGLEVFLPAELIINLVDGRFLESACNTSELPPVLCDGIRWIDGVC